MKLYTFFFSTILFSELSAQSMTTYTNHKEDISISHPNDWVIQMHPLTTFIFVNPKQGQTQEFRENVNLVISEHNEISIEIYIYDAERQMKSNLSEYQRLSIEFLNLNGDYFVKHSYKHNFREIIIKSVCYTCIKNKKVYSLTFSCLDRDFEKYRPVFEKMFYSFRIN